MKIKYLCLLAFVVPLIGCNQNNNIVDVASYVDTTGKKDCSRKIQELINKNPNRTLYFRDGTYLLDRQILTPGDPTKSVDLQLSNYAILKASNRYQVKRTGDYDHEYQDEYLYMVCLGGLDKKNDVVTPGSVYSFTGGIIDGSGKAAGIEIAGGRETRVQNVSMKGVEVGLRIAKGVNSGSSDADIRDLSIICNDKEESYGLKLDGSDNTVSNVRIGHVTHGVYSKGGSNLLSYVHPLHNADCLKYHYDASIGFEIDNYTQLNNCYSDNFRVAYKIHESHAFITDCIAWWFNPGGTKRDQIAVEKAATEFNATITNFAIGVNRAKEGEPATTAKIMEGKSTETDDVGIIHNVHARNRDLITDITQDGKFAPTGLFSEYTEDTEVHDYK